jgi:hypothetical protein
VVGHRDLRCLKTKAEARSFTCVNLCEAEFKDVDLPRA